MANATTSRREFSLGRLVATLALVAIAAGVAYQLGVQSVEPPDESDALMIYGMDRPVQNRLHAQYTDANRDLVADSPKNESERVDPDVLKFSYLATEQGRYREVWSDFLEYLAEETRKASRVPRD